MNFWKKHDWSDKEYVLEAVKKNGDALRFASEDLKKDREIVLEAVKKNGDALRFASEDLQQDREIVLEAVKNNNLALLFASHDLRNDREFVVKKIKGDGHCLFRAFAKSVDGNQEKYQLYRDKAADYIEKHEDMHKFIDGCQPAEYVEELRSGGMWGGDLEIRALAMALKRQVKVYEKENDTFILRHQYPDSQDKEAPDLEKGSAIIHLLFHPNQGDSFDKAGHYDLLVEKPPPTKVDRALIGKLKQGEQQLQKVWKEYSKRRQTSFLKKEILDVGLENRTEDKSTVLETVVETIAEITRQKNWFRDEQTLCVIYDVLCDLQSMDVSGVPEENILCMSPVVIFLNFIAWLIYYPLSIILMVLLMIARVQGWVTLITGFAGASLSGLAAAATQNKKLALASNVLGIITGILAAAKGITLNEDYLYRRAEELTLEVLHRAFGNISKDSVFQPLQIFRPSLRRQCCWGCCGTKHFDEFKMTLKVKKADIRKVQDVRMFFQLVVSTNLVQKPGNFSQIDRMMNVSERVEEVLIDPYNYVTFQELTDKKKKDRNKYKFESKDVTQIKEIYKKIRPDKSFCTFLQQLNQEEILPLVNPDVTKSGKVWLVEKSE